MMYKLLILFLAVKFLVAAPFARGADTNAPTATASCFDGRTIGVCFSEVVDAASATNLANYRVLLLNNRAEYDTSQSEYVVTSAELRPDRQSVLLHLNKAYPGTRFRLMITNVQDLAGNSRLMSWGTRVHNLGLHDIGSPGIDPREPGAVFNCADWKFQVSAGGSGLGGTNDSFTFVCQPWRVPGVHMEAGVYPVEPVSRFTSGGLMVREDLSPGARFFSILVTAPDVPVQDGSGTGFNRARVLYREEPNGPVTEVPLPNALGTTAGLLEISRDRNLFRGSIRDTPTEAFVTFTRGFSDSSFIGMVAFSGNNQFSADAMFEGYRFQITDLPPPPKLEIRRNVNDLLISWTELPDIEYFLLETSNVRALLWQAVTNRTVKVRRDAQTWDATTTVPLKPGQIFYGLSFSRY